MSKQFRPTTPTRRFLVLPSDTQLAEGGKNNKSAPYKKLTTGKKSQGGRNNLGRITCRHRGGGHKQKFREIDFLRDKEAIIARVASIEYDPNRSAFIALLNYQDGEKKYILAPQGIKIGDQIGSGKESGFGPGCSMLLLDMPIGSVVHNIELHPGKGATLVRSAGSSAQLLGRANGYASIRMPSGEKRLINQNCRATFGVVSNPEHILRKEGKAGRKRWMGIRPTVRGVAMNPVDHPHGGGEGRGKGNHPQSPTGVPAKGYKTRSKRKNSRFIVEKRKG